MLKFILRPKKVHDVSATSPPWPASWSAGDGMSGEECASSSSYGDGGHQLSMDELPRSSTASLRCGSAGTYADDQDSLAQREDSATEYAAPDEDPGIENAETFGMQEHLSVER